MCVQWESCLRPGDIGLQTQGRSAAPLSNHPPIGACVRGCVHGPSGGPASRQAASRRPPSAAGRLPRAEKRAEKLDGGAFLSRAPRHRQTKPRHGFGRGRPCLIPSARTLCARARTLGLEHAPSLGRPRPGTARTPTPPPGRAESSALGKRPFVLFTLLRVLLGHRPPPMTYPPSPARCRLARSSVTHRKIRPSHPRQP